MFAPLWFSGVLTKPALKLVRLAAQFANKINGTENGISAYVHPLQFLP